MDLKPALEMLGKSKDFKKWKSKNKEAFFSFAFKIKEEMSQNEWQLGFYSKKKDKVTTFVVKGSAITIRPDEDIFKKEETEVKEITLDKVAISFDTVVSKSEEFQQKSFPKDSSIKTIAILQNLSGLGNVWNITYLTQAFNTLNMKIDAANGKVLEHNLSSILSFRKD